MRGAWPPFLPLQECAPLGGGHESPIETLAPQVSSRCQHAAADPLRWHDAAGGITETGKPCRT